MELNGSLLREKFTLHDVSPSGNRLPDPIIALGNRLDIHLKGREDIEERFIIRGHNMHMCIRMASRIASSFSRLGSLVNRTEPYDWEYDWNAVFNDYERSFNKDLWLCVYYDGKPVFTYKDHHPFLDMVEKFSAQNPDHYDDCLPLAESAFKASGKNIDIEHEAKTALTITIEGELARIGVIHRAPNQSSTFNFSVSPSEGKAINAVQVIGSAAAFLEAIQLAFMIGMNSEKIRIGIIERFSKAEKQTREARQRLGRLNTEIINIEQHSVVRYRPEKPDFEGIMNEAEELGRRILEPPPEDNEEAETEAEAKTESEPIASPEPEKNDDHT